MRREMTTKTINRWISAEEEGDSWRRVLDMRAAFSRDVVSRIRVDSKEDAITEARNVILKVLSTLETAGVTLERADTGHGIGHMIRDYVHAFALLPKIHSSPQDTFVGLVAGVLHDIGCAVVPRYSEPHRAVRHAEIGALLVGETLDGLGVEEAERLAIMYAIAAHTNYRTASRVLCEDGVERKVTPYMDVDENGPIMAVHFPRWVDRLDLIGPTIVGRHLLTLADPHRDYTGEHFYDVGFQQHLELRLRPVTEVRASKIPATMLEHLALLAGIGEGITPYNQYDTPSMIEMRDGYKESTKKIISAVLTDTTFDFASDEANTAWWRFLRNNIEPSPNGHRSVNIIQDQFVDLSSEVQAAWKRGFTTTMCEYNNWFKKVDGLDFERVVPFFGDVYALLTPRF